MSKFTIDEDFITKDIFKKQLSISEEMYQQLRAHFFFEEQDGFIPYVQLEDLVLTANEICRQDGVDINSDSYFPTIERLVKYTIFKETRN
jgi:hypothetical protein